ncbi:MULTISPECIES: LysR family transcriptional regulator [Aeromicrobium]|uniref:LysR family transcriptional regulator n=1 Tax=Aeromicrobium phoceense TaxID=2754045 RepID=A0A838XLE0_9ACTN|nr:MULTISPECIES: LysR family transcriptional regulator [Aeromicrobium]MBA4607690.1 LysR family transcriptional regulator [Aeromicrobium phoceense]
MDTRRLAMLRELAERGTVGAVADEMNVTPSAVSQQLKLLEAEAGVPLLEPAGRGVRLTAAGRALAETATEVAVALERAEARWREYLGGPAGDVTLTVFPTGGEMLLPGLLTRVVAEPAVNLICTDRDPTQRFDVLDMVANFDIVVADSPAATEEWHDRGLQLVSLLREPLDVALPESHRLAAKQSLSPKDVIGETWIGAPHGYPYDRVLQQLVAVTGESVRIAQRFDDNGVVEAVVAAGHGIAILPRFTTRTRDNGLVTRPLVGIRARRDITAVLRPDRFERPSVRFCVQALREEARTVADRHAAV